MEERSSSAAKFASPLGVEWVLTRVLRLRYSHEFRGPRRGQTWVRLGSQQCVVVAMA
jgi:hypothetical protein